MSEKFRVLIVQIRPDVDREEAVRNLARLFKSDEARIKALLRRKPAVVKSGLDREAALKYQAALEKAGLVARVAPVDSGDSPKKPAAPPKPTPGDKPRNPVEVCPNCGYEAFSPEDPLVVAHEGEGECPRCGIMRRKFVKARLAREMAARKVVQIEEGEVDLADVRIRRHESRFVSLWQNNLFKVALGLAVILLFVGGWWFFVSDWKESLSAQDKPRPKRTARTGGDQSPQSKLTNPCHIAAGQTKTVIIKGYAPIIHNRDGFSSLEVAYSMMDNPWYPFGVEVDMVDQVVEWVDHDIWAVAENFKSPYFPNGLPIHRAVMPNGRPVNDLVFIDVANQQYITWHKTWEQKQILNVSQMELKDAFEEWGTGASKRKEYSRQTWAFYPFTITLNVTVPDEAALRGLSKDKDYRNKGKIGFGPSRMFLSYSSEGKTIDMTHGVMEREFDLKMRLLPHRTEGFLVLDLKLTNQYHELICQ